MSIKYFIVSVALLSFCAAGLWAQEFALSTNFADYAEFGTLNVEASYGVARHWSLSAAVKYNPFTYSRGDELLQHKQRSLSAGVRYWPWHIYSGWWLSAAVRYQEYNSGGIISPETREGDRFGGLVGGGYTYMIAPWLNFDMGLGLWSGYDSFTTYACPSCGKRIDGGGKFFFLPADVLLSLTFVF